MLSQKNELRRVQLLKFAFEWRHCLFAVDLAYSIGQTLSNIGVVLSWIRSFIVERTEAASLAGQQSGKSSAICGVPQECELGPVLFLCCPSDVRTR